MALVQLSLENLKNLKGGLAERMLNAALNRIALDLQNAPDIGEARKVTLEILAKPIVEFAIGQKCPKRITSARRPTARSNCSSRSILQTTRTR